MDTARDGAGDRVLRLYERWRRLTRQQAAAVAAGDHENAATLAHQVRLLRGALRRLEEPPHEVLAPRGGAALRRPRSFGSA
jgi:hypothetical protein